MSAIQLTGSTTLLPSMQRAAEAYMARHASRIVINGGCGTARGYKALLDGTTDVAMASGPAADEVAAQAAARGLAFQATVVGHDAILQLVHAANPVASLSLQQLGDIFTGRVDNWRSVGGPDAPIAVLVGPPGGGISRSWHALVLGADDTLTPQRRVMAAEERLAHIAAHRFAVTYVADSAALGPRVRTLRVNGMASTSAHYPLHATMQLVTLGAASAPAARFIAHAAGRRHEPA